MHFLSDFADLAVLLPLYICIGGGLALSGWRRGALVWVVAVGGTFLTMLLLKLLFLGCGTERALSPSGHTAAGTAIYGGAACLWLRRHMPAWPAVLLAGGSVATVIGVSRVAIGAHIPIEVAIGGVVGLAGIMLLLRAAGPPPIWVHTRWLLPAGLLVVIALHGTRLPAEQRLRAWAGWLPRTVCEKVRI